MPDADKILSQSEVDALLSAIGSGEVEVPRDVAAEVPAVPYDFKRPQCVSRDRLRAIETLHEVYARNLQSALSGMLRTSVDVKLARVDQVSFEEFLHSLPNPTVIAVLSATPLGGSFLLEINPSIAFPIIERLLGSGRIGGIQPERPFTRIEWNLIETVIAKALELLKEVWSPVGMVEFRVSGRESDPPMLRAATPNEPVVTVALEVVIGEHKGGLNLALPAKPMEGHLDRMAARAGPARGAGEEPAVSRQLAPAEVEMSVHLPPGRLSLGEVAGLRPGDLLLTGRSPSEPLLLSVEGRPKFQVKPGAVKDRKAFKVLGPGGAEEERRMEIRRGAAGPEAEAAAESMRGSLDRLVLEESVVLAERTLRMSEVLALKPGDVLEFPKRADEPLELRVGRRARADGRAVRIGERFGLQISALRPPKA